MVTPGDSAQRTRYAIVVRAASLFMASLPETRPSPSRPLVIDRPLIIDRPLVIDNPLIIDRPLTVARLDCASPVVLPEGVQTARTLASPTHRVVQPVILEPYIACDPLRGTKEHKA